VFDVVDVNFCAHQALLQDHEEARRLAGVGALHAKLLDRLLSLRTLSLDVGLMAVCNNELSGPICHRGFPALTLPAGARADAPATWQSLRVATPLRIRRITEDNSSPSVERSA